VPDRTRLTEETRLELARASYHLAAILTSETHTVRGLLAQLPRIRNDIDAALMADDARRRAEGQQEEETRRTNAAATAEVFDLMDCGEEWTEADEVAAAETAAATGRAIPLPEVNRRLNALLRAMHAEGITELRSGDPDPR
jgi:hypothetical protein